jgi:hypothetical protein
MPNPLVTQHYPDDFAIASFVFTGALINDPSAILYADRTLVIDQIVVGVHAAGTSSGAGALSFEISNSCIGTSGNSIGVVTVDGANVTAGDHVILDGVGTTVYKYTAGVAAACTGCTQLKWLNTSNTTIDNVIPAGSWLVVDSTGTTTGARVTIQVRYRSRQA